MAEARKSYPLETTLGEECMYWRLEDSVGCHFPKAQMVGRVSCEGIIDDVCLYLKDGRQPASLSPQQLVELKTRIPGTQNRDIPPGNTIK